MSLVKYIRSFWLLVFLAPCSLWAQHHVRYYVSLKGNDSFAGTIEKPFATAEGARLAVRKHIKEHPHDTITIFFRKGVYSFKQSFSLNSLDSGNETTPVTYCAYPNEEVKFSGGISIPVSKAINITDRKILDRLVPEARKNILQVNLRTLGLNDFGILKPKGFGRPSSAAAMELFCNEQAMKLSRWPNDSLVPIGKVLDPGSIPRNGDSSQRGGKFTYAVTRPARWKEANEIWISGFFRYGFADDAVRIAKLDTINKTITTARETIYGFEGGKEFQRWFAFNLLEEIDQPGEYFIDRDNGMLYFYPPAGKLSSISLSILETPLVSLLNASHIVFQNIIFENSRGIGIYIEKGKDILIENCTIRNMGMMGISFGREIKPFESREAGAGHVVKDCDIYNTGSGGIILSGGDRLTLKKGNNQILNCRIHDFNRLERSYKAGVNIEGVGNIIRNNEIFNCPGSAIYLHGNDHLIELNNIHHAVTDGNDMGAVYYGRDPTEQGNKIRNNFFHHIGNDHGMIMAVYHDDGACGMEVTGNVFYKAGSRTVMIGGGNDNIYRNNIFIDCPLAFHLDSRLTGWAKGFVADSGLFKQRMEAVNYKRSPYSTAYPELVNYFKDSLGLPKRNFIENNVFVNVKTLHNGKKEWARIGLNFYTDNDPGFVDSTTLNFGLKTNSAVYKELPDFKPIPFEKIGVQSNK